MGREPQRNETLSPHTFINMALGQLEKEETKKKVYLSISHGKVVKYTKNGGQDFYKYIEGTLEDIYLKERVFNGKKAKFWYIDLRDGGELYSLSLPYVSGTLKSIILALASETELSRNTHIRIEPYEKGGFTKVQVYADGVLLDWITKELPPIKEIVVGENTYKDDTERMALVAKLANEIAQRVKKI